jgi:hypothetical protein
MVYGLWNTKNCLAPDLLFPLKICRTKSRATRDAADKPLTDTPIF